MSLVVGWVWLECGCSESGLRGSLVGVLVCMCYTKYIRSGSVVCGVQVVIV